MQAAIIIQLSDCSVGFGMLQTTRAILSEADIYGFSTLFLWNYIFG